jgi:hypothetical protein
MPAYSVTNLGTFGGQYPKVSALSDAGVVVGHVDLNGHHAIRYQNGVISELPVTSGAGAQANGISPSQPERIVGELTGSLPAGATLWTNGAYTDLSPLFASAFATAVDVNDDGIVAGFADPWCLRVNTVTNQVEKLFMPDGNSTIDEINKSGHIVGLIRKNWQITPYLFTKTLHVIHTPGPIDEDSSVHVNDHDVIAGTYRVPDLLHAFTYDYKSKVFRDIHGGQFIASSAAGINNDGVVVGTAFDSFDSYAFVWTEIDGMQRLIDLVDADGWTLGSVVGINEQGQIAGNGIHNGKYRAFLLTPVPESDEGEQKPGPKDLVGMVRELLLAGGAIGILLPDGSIIYPKDGPVDPDSPLQREIAVRSDIAVGLAMRVLASRISDPATRATAINVAEEIAKHAAQKDQR